MTTSNRILDFIGKGGVTKHYPKWSKIKHPTIREYSPSYKEESDQSNEEFIAQLYLPEDQDPKDQHLGLKLCGPWTEAAKKVTAKARFSYNPDLDCIETSIDTKQDWTIENFQIFLTSKNRFLDVLTWQYRGEESSKHLQSGDLYITSYVWRY